MSYSVCALLPPVRGSLKWTPGTWKPKFDIVVETTKNTLSKHVDAMSWKAKGSNLKMRASSAYSHIFVTHQIITIYLNIHIVNISIHIYSFKFLFGL